MNEADAENPCWKNNRETAIIEKTAFGKSAVSDCPDSKER